MAKTQTPAQRVANPVWLRDQLRQLARDCDATIEEDQKLAAETRDDDRRKIFFDRIESNRYWKRQFERVLRGQTHIEDLDAFMKREGTRR